MKWTVIVKPNAKKTKVEQKNSSEIFVHVSAPPVNGKANQQVTELLAKYFNVAKTKIKILHGENSRKKLIEIA